MILTSMYILYSNLLFVNFGDKKILLDIEQKSKV